MNPTNWPLIGEHPSWCGGFFCAHTDLGYIHSGNPTYLRLGDDRWELTLQRADEPDPGETMICVVVTSDTFEEGPVQHMLALADAAQLIEALIGITEQARDEAAAPVLEVVR